MKIYSPSVHARDDGVVGLAVARDPVCDDDQVSRKEPGQLGERRAVFGAELDTIAAQNPEEIAV